MAATLIETSDNLTPEREHIIKWVSGSLYAAGSDTVSTSPYPGTIDETDRIVR
jgi:hypothetical protein